MGLRIDPISGAKIAASPYQIAFHYYYSQLMHGRSYEDCRREALKNQHPVEALMQIEPEDERWDNRTLVVKRVNGPTEVSHALPNSAKALDRWRKKHGLEERYAMHY